MNDRLRKYIDELFKDAPKNARTEEYKEEILKNNEEKLADLIAGGMDEEEAFKTVAAGMGDMNELFEELRGGEETTPAAPKREEKPKKRRRLPTVAIVFIVIGAVVLLGAAVLALSLGAYAFERVETVVEENIDAWEDRVEDGAEKLEQDMDAWEDRIEDKIEGPLDPEAPEPNPDGMSEGIYKDGALSFETECIEDITVNWPSGNVLIYPAESLQVIIKEEVTGVDAPEMESYVKDGKLVINYGKDDIWSITDNLGTKTLELYLPENMIAGTAQIDLNIRTASADIYTSMPMEVKRASFSTASGNITAEHVTATSMRAETVSGEITFDDISSGSIRTEAVSGEIWVQNISANKVEAESTSGSMTVNNAVIAELDVENGSGDIEIREVVINNADASTISGKIYFEFEDVPTELDIETTSGDVEIYVPEESAFRLAFESVSGNVKTDLPFSQTGKGYQFGDNPKAVFDVETISGDVTVAAK